MQGITAMHDTFCSAQNSSVRYHSFTGFANEDICIFYRIYFCLRMVSNMRCVKMGTDPHKTFKETDVKIVNMNK